MSYDSKCYDLAREFLDDEPGLNTIDNAKELAQDIQDALEDFMRERGATAGGGRTEE